MLGPVSRLFAKPKRSTEANNREECDALHAQLVNVGNELVSLREERDAMHAQLVNVGKELIGLREERDPMQAQLVNVGKELISLREERNALHAQLVGVGKERDDLRELGNKAGLLEAQRVAMEYYATRYRWQNLAICGEYFGPPESQPKPVAEMPAELRDAYTLGGRIPVEATYMD